MEQPYTRRRSLTPKCVRGDRLRSLTALACLAAVARDSLGGLIGVGLILLGLVLKLRQEGQFLEAQFGPAYDDYKKDVPALIPGFR